MKRIDQGKIAFIFIILISIWTVYYLGYTKGIAPINSLRKNKVYTTAIITDETFMIKGRNYYVYKFKVGGKEYEGHSIFYRNSPISAGDSVRIVYDKTNPDYSMTVRAYYSSVYLRITGFEK
ncbi:DUF3592 domain-containing protein [Bacteroides cellulosilyticus]|uniref:DUF3592 domain-containing protein n=1 Tax=Bacteroides cellulosilyticus TaxID=246787 RepID=UPI0032EE64CB